MHTPVLNLVHTDPDSVSQPVTLPLQAASQDIWEHKYQLMDGETMIDTCVEDGFRRVAKALASVEDHPEKWEPTFFWALKNGAIPAGRIMSNAGAQRYKAATSTINCTVSGTVHDSMDDILKKAHEAGMTLKVGSGIGYDFSTLRPKGAVVAGAGAYTSGPLSFMDIFDKICQTISSAGGRRGAQMATFDIGHPDVLDFIQAKRENGRLRQFNLSLLITHEFVAAVRSDTDWPLAFPVLPAEASTVDLDDPNQVIWKTWPTSDHYIQRDDGLVACRIYRTVKARDLWKSIMDSTYDYAEPGFILIDRVNEMNNNWWCETIRATNPCGEQPLPPYGSCLLGSVNLTQFVGRPFTHEASFDWTRFRKVVRVFTRMLDNVVEIHGLSLQKQADELLRKRRHGMGFFGLGSSMVMLGMNYGDPESAQFAERITREMALTGWSEALALAQEKGPAPIMDEMFLVTQEMLRLRPEMKSAYAVGDSVPGRVLHARFSRYMQKIAEADPELVKKLANTGARFTHHTSIAPTGTIALSFGNNASNGIEPSFAHHYSRNVVRKDKKTKEKIEVCSYELLAYQTTQPEIGDVNDLPKCFVDANDIHPEQHIAIQAAVQKWVDSSISKTINVPTDIDPEKFSDVYLNAVDSGLKGCTTFRFNPTAFQGVLVLDKDLAATTYTFTLEDGSQVTAKGGEEIEYDGEVHTAANLFDALKEGNYGRM